MVSIIRMNRPRKEMGRESNMNVRKGECIYDIAGKAGKKDTTRKTKT
jgi:hypothetical protein